MTAGDASSAPPARRGADVTTFQLGGPLRRFAECPDAATMRDVLRGAAAAGDCALLIGGGSNLLISDAGWDGVVARFRATVPDIERHGDEVCVSGATDLDALAAFCVEEGLEGLTFATGIPGTVGGALAGNAGAYGEQMADRLVSAALFDPRTGTRETPRSAIAFGYRHSSLRDSGAVVESIRLRLRPGDRAQLRDERARILDWRRAHHPDWHECPCAGSFFRNIEPTSAAGRRQAAGWFLEQAGAKAMRVGGAAVYEKHANIIVKRAPDCTAADVRTLSHRMAEAVRERFGIALTREVQLIGEFDGAPPN